MIENMTNEETRGRNSQTSSLGVGRVTHRIIIAMVVVVAGRRLWARHLF